MVTFVLAWCTQRAGLEFSPDAWQYWAGSIAILEGRGYVDGNGLAILGWPPGYSLYLAAWQACLGVSVATVRLAECFALASSAALVMIWMRLRLRSGVTWPLAVASTAACLAAARGAGSERLTLMLLYLTMVCIELLRGRQGLRYALLVAAITLCCTAMGLVKHAALAFLPGLWFLLREHDRDSWRRPLLSLAVIVAVTSATWLGTRKLVGQTSEGWFESVHGIGSVLGAMAKGLNRGLAPWPIGLLLFAGLLLAVGPLRRRAARMLGLPEDRLRHGPVAAFVLTSLGALLTMYLIVYVADLPNARFMRFASITVAVLLAGLAVQVTRPGLRWVLLVLVLVPNVAYATKHAIKGRRVPDTRTEHGGASFLTPDCVLGPPGSAEERLPDGRIRVPEPVFRWQRERLESGKGR